MSPSENDLRAALRDGEDDGRPDVDGLLAHVRGRRAQRRTRVLSTAAAVVVVAAAAVGGAALWGGSDGHGRRAGSSPGATLAPPGSTSSASFGVSRGRLPCPITAPRPLDPPGLTPATPPNTRMFAEPVARVDVCAYTEAGSGASPSRIEFTGQDATALAASIEHAAPSKLKIMCPDIASQQRTQLAIIGVTAGGTQLPVVTTDVSIPNCNRPITNGTAVRYAWKPPAALASRIAALNVRALPSGGTAGAKIGTPVR